MKTRRHHNNDGRRQIKRGKTRDQVKRMADRLGIPYGSKVGAGDTPQTYDALVKGLEERKCKTCCGTGKCDDADLGDIWYREWVCTVCGGTGLLPNV